LNLFAENVSKAEALCAEIANILRGLRNMAASPIGMNATHALEMEVGDKAAGAQTRC